LGFELWIDAAEERGVEAGGDIGVGWFGFSENPSQDKGSDRFDVGIGRDEADEAGVVVNGAVVTDDREMGGETEDSLTEIVVEARHDADDDDEDADAESDSEHGDESDDGDESPFRPKVTQGEK
jgi:hypothetical protein